MIINFINSLTRADEYINTLFYISRDASAIKLFTWITLLGESSTIILFTLIASIVLWLINKKWQMLGLLLSVVGSAGTTLLAKIIFNRPRPLNAALLETSASFPSGHAAIAIAFYGFITYLLIKETKKKRDRILVTLFGFILITLIGFSRLYLGVHYVSDVLAGYLDGILWLIIGIKLNNYSRIKNEV